MPGAWEQVEPSVAIVVLTRETVTTKWAIHLRSLQFPDGHHFMPLSGMPFDHARNVGCHAAVNGGFKYVFFLDDDVLIPPDTFFRLAAHNKDIVSGVYFRRHDPLCPVMLRDTPEGTKWVTELPANSLVEVDLMGAGCLLVKTDLLRQMGAHPFEWRSDRYDLPEKERVSEDFAFCRRARREFDKRIYVDTSILCPHIGICESYNGQLYPSKLMG